MATSLELEYVNDDEFALLDAAVLEADAAIAARTSLAVAAAPSTSHRVPAGTVIPIISSQAGGVGVTFTISEAGRVCVAIQTAEFEPSARGTGQREQGREERIAALLEDLEDIGSKHNRRQERRARGLNVTDISMSEWCQQQVAFSLSARLPKDLKQTPAMLAGTEQHTLLEAETSDLVEIDTQTREDAFAVSMLNTTLKIRQLLTEGMTREVNVFGKLQGRLIRGIIDQLEFDEHGKVCVVEQKTRFQPSLPSDSQKRTTCLQVMLYRQLLEGLARTVTHPDVIEVLEEMGLDDCADLSTAVTEYAESHGIRITRLPEIARHLCDAAKALPALSDVMLVNYFWQGDGQLLEQEKVHFDAEFLTAKLSQHLGFWEGEEPPQQVSQHERWKCARCHFRGKCFPAQVRKVPWAH